MAQHRLQLPKIYEASTRHPMERPEGYIRSEVPPSFAISTSNHLTLAIAKSSHSFQARHHGIQDLASRAFLFPPPPRVSPEPHRNRLPPQHSRDPRDKNDTNTTQETTSRRVSYFVYDGQAIIDSDVRFGTEEEILQAAVDPLTKRSASTKHSKRALSQSTPNRWPGGRIEYRCESELTRASRHVDFEVAIKRWADTLPFLQFVEVSPPADVPWSPSGPRTIRAIEGTVSWSDIGGAGGEIRLGDHGLDSIGVYTHEIGHTLGLYHEHKRPDRDDYVEVVCENMWQPSDCATGSGWAAQFSKEQPEWVNWAGKYDVNSVMHYDPWAFSNGLGPVLKSKTVTELCSRCRESPTKTDAQRVCEIYWEDCHSVCGDGILSPQYKECDDGNNLNGDSCSTARRTQGPSAATVLSTPVKSTTIARQAARHAISHVERLYIRTTAIGR